MNRAASESVVGRLCFVAVVAALAGIVGAAPSVALERLESGAEAGAVVADATDAGDSGTNGLEQALEGVAPEIQAATEGKLLDGAADVATLPPTPEPTGGGDAFGIRFDSDRPVSIRSEELESSKTNGSRKVVFTKNVVVEQDDVTIRSQRLEAYYPPETSQPSRMVASDRVWMSNGDYVARCDEATYEREADTLTCRGNAEMREGEDCVAGNWIEFDLSAETVKVGGGAKVVLGVENDGREPGACL